MTEMYHYNHDGRTLSLPYLSNVKMGVVRKLRSLSVEEQFFGLLEAVLDDSQLAIVDDMDAREFNDLLESWQKASGVQLGESTASSQTSNGTARPSNTTSSVPDGHSMTSPTG